jgi:hypothetical protein
MMAPLQRCATMALDGIQREFPHHFPLVLDGPTTFTRPRDLTPVFYGCYDWHSAVHSHWLLVRLLNVWDEKPGFSESRASQSVILQTLADRFTAEHLAVEFQFLNDPLRTGFERPYGLAWLLQLSAELRASPLTIATEWLRDFEPLEQLAAERFRRWLPRLAGPIRTGEHSQTAFALGLVVDWSRVAGDTNLTALLNDSVLRFYGSDHDLPLRWEPSEHDFLSPALATADVVRRFVSPTAFADWLTGALPGFPEEQTLLPVSLPSDLSDGKVAHCAGLNFSRAWMLDGMASGLPADDLRRPWLERLRDAHLYAGRPALQSDEYAVTHWVGSFAVYALTRRGLGLRS